MVQQEDVLLALKVFDCKVFAHVPKAQRTKLDDKSIPCIFIEYRDEEFRHRLWNPVKKKVNSSRDVIFRESEVGIAHDLSKKAPKKTGIVPNIVIILSSCNHTISVKSGIL